MSLYLCVECGIPNEALFRIFTKSALTLQTCVNCQCIIDKYIEYDFTAVFIDILLLKISAYRHVLFNSQDKAYLPRLLALTLLSCSYVEWVFAKQNSEANNEENTREPTFYELEWGYYVIILQQTLEAAIFAATFLLFSFFASKSRSTHTYRIPQIRILEGIALAYCWNLVIIPSLVWNHYSTYKLLSQVALLISCNHIFHVCVERNYFYSIITTSCSYTLQWSARKWMQENLTL